MTYVFVISSGGVQVGLEEIVKEQVQKIVKQESKSSL